MSHHVLQILELRKILRGKGEVWDEILFSTVSGTEFYVLSCDAV